MELRALLFTADGSSTATLCRVMTELGLEAQICSEMLVAVERISRESYDALIVDWELETEAAFLLKTAREQKNLALNLALVADEADIPRALQHGANSVIKKPVDPLLAHDTLSTARDLILSRRVDQRAKDSRFSQEPMEFNVEAPLEEAAPPKPGFLSQSSTRSALEAEQKVGRPEPPAELRWQAARGPASLEQEQQPETEVPPVSKERWDSIKTIFRGETDTPTDTLSTPPSQDSQAFSPLPEAAEPEPAEEDASPAPPRYVVFSVIACVLVAAVLYVWAPGDTYLGRVSSTFHAWFTKARSSNVPKAEAGTSTPQKVVPETPPVPAIASKPVDVPVDPPAIESTDVDPSRIQIIETKAIPKAGAQQPASREPLVEPDQKAEPVPSPSVPPEIKTEPIEPKRSEAPATTEPVAMAPQIPAPPAPATYAKPDISVPASEGRVGVIIPDSLRNTPAPSPGSSLEPFSVPEATALSLLIHRVDPDYPAQALQQRVEGPVVLQAWIGKDGSIRDLKLLKGYFVLGRAAFDAVRQWRFKPYSQNGKPTEFQTSITLNFKYPGKSGQ